MVSKKCYDSKLPQVLQKPCGSFLEPKKRRSFKNKTGGFFSQLMMEREYGRKDGRRDDNKNSKTLNLEHYNNDTAKEILSIVLCCCSSSSGFDGFIICRSVKKISTQVMMMILSQPCWVSNNYGLTNKLECALLVHQLHTYVANYPST